MSAWSLILARMLYKFPQEHLLNYTHTTHTQYLTNINITNKIYTSIASKNVYKNESFSYTWSYLSDFLVDLKYLQTASINTVVTTEYSNNEPNRVKVAVRAVSESKYTTC